MYYLSYASVAVTPFTSAALQALLLTSRRNNMQLGITGMLLYKDGEFMQVLEGEQAAVQALYA
ncbi:MAG: BLUF domain-containing protein, partial [Roseiflexaceae bacterium]